MEILPEEAARLSAKQHMVRLIRIVKEENSYFSEFLMHFYMIPTPTQRAFLSHMIQAEVGPASWDDLYHDEFLWRDLIKCILMFFSGVGKGRGGTVQPDKKEFLIHIADFIRSPACEAADREVEDGPRVTFTEMMESL